MEVVARRPQCPARARESRYQLLGDLVGEAQPARVATAPSLDDQRDTADAARTGCRHRGLGATRASAALVEGVELVRPLLGWRKASLRRLSQCRRRGDDDRSNRDLRTTGADAASGSSAPTGPTPSGLRQRAWLNEPTSARLASAPLAAERLSAPGRASNSILQTSRRAAASVAPAILPTRRSADRAGPSFPGRSTPCARAERRRFRASSSKAARHGDCDRRQRGGNKPFSESFTGS